MARLQIKYGCHPSYRRDAVEEIAVYIKIYGLICCISIPKQNRNISKSVYSSRDSCCYTSRCNRSARWEKTLNISAVKRVGAISPRIRVVIRRRIERRLYCSHWRLGLVIRWRNAFSKNSMVLFHGSVYSVNSICIRALIYVFINR
jgi:hypothetical protein